MNIKLCLDQNKILIEQIEDGKASSVHFLHFDFFTEDLIKRV